MRVESNSNSIVNPFRITGISIFIYTDVDCSDLQIVLAPTDYLHFLSFRLMYDMITVPDYALVYHNIY